MLRTSGIFDVIVNAIKSLFMALGTDTRFVDGLPTALIRPLSGAGGRGMMVDTMRIFGPIHLPEGFPVFFKVRLILRSM